MIEVRKEVLAATGGQQVPWDHSALTGDFYFHLAAAPGACPRSAPIGGRHDAGAAGAAAQLEEELKRKADPQQTASWSSWRSSRSACGSSTKPSRADQQRIFDTYRK